MLTIARAHDVGNGEVPMGTAETAAELHALLFDAFLPGVYRIRNPDTGKVVRADLEAPVPDNPEFSERIVQALAMTPAQD